MAPVRIAEPTPLTFYNGRYSMDYRQAVDFVLSRSNLESAVSQVRYREFHLERVRRFLDLLGAPDGTLPLVHVAGTKGKGSTVAMAASILTAAGYRTGRFTSPHLHTIRERIATPLSPSERRRRRMTLSTLLVSRPMRSPTSRLV